MTVVLSGELAATNQLQVLVNLAISTNRRLQKAIRHIIAKDGLERDSSVTVNHRSSRKRSASVSEEAQSVKVKFCCEI